MSLPFEKLQSYQLALKFVARADILIKESNERMSSRLSDQLSRAALSIPLNIAEGAGRWHKPAKMQFVWIARGSTFECVAIRQVLRVQKLIGDDDYGTDSGARSLSACPQTPFEDGWS